MRRVLALFAGLVLGSVVRITGAEAGCSIGLFTMSFGTVDILSGAAFNSSTQFALSCSFLINTTGELGMGCGSGSSCTGNVRTMVSGTDTLRVEFYTSSAYSSIWQAEFAGNPGSYTGAALGVGLSNSTVNHTVYGRVLSGQSTAKPGTYTWNGGSTPWVRYCTDLLCLFTAVDGNPSASTATVTISPNCNVSSTSPVAFPTTGLLASTVDATGSISVQCTNGTTYAVGLDNGQNASAGTRRLKHASQAAYVPFTLYRDSGRSLAWGNTVGVDTLSGTGTGLGQSLPVYGRIAAQGTTPAPGNYSDSVVVTVTF